MANFVPCERDQAFLLPPDDRAKDLRAKLAADIAELTKKAEAADAQDDAPQSLPKELARREALKAKLDAACERIEAEARAEAEAARPAYEAKKAAYDPKKGRRRERPPTPPDDTETDHRTLAYRHEGQAGDRDWKS